MKIKFSKKEWESLGKVKIAQNNKPTQNNQPTQNNKPVQPNKSNQPSQQRPVGNTYYAHYKLNKESGDTNITVTDDKGVIISIVKTGPNAREEENDIINDYNMMQNIDDLNGLRHFLFRSNLIGINDQIIKAK